MLLQPPERQLFQNVVTYTYWRAALSSIAHYGVPSNLRIDVPRKLTDRGSDTLLTELRNLFKETTSNAFELDFLRSGSHLIRPRHMY